MPRHSYILPSMHSIYTGYGFLSPTAKVPIADLKAKVGLVFGFTVTVPVLYNFLQLMRRP